MPAFSCISPDQTVRQVANASPACARLLERWPGARFDGRWTLQQLAWFARTRGLDERALLDDLASAAGVPARYEAQRPREHSPMPLIFTALIVGLSMGTAWGVGLLLRIAAGGAHDVVPAQSVHVHGLVQFWGWLALFVFAVAAHMLRQNTKRPAPAWLNAAAGGCVVIGLLLFIATMSHAVRSAFPRADAAGSMLLAAATACFAVSALWSLKGRGQRPQLWHGYVLAMIAWLVTWSATDLSLRLRSSGAGSQLSDAARALLIALPVFGFATNAIYGFGIRLIPGLLNVGRLRPRCFAAALPMHNVGLCMFLTSLRSARIVGAALMLGSAVVYVIGMDALRIKPSRPIYGIDTRGHVLIRVAFFWLLAGMAMVFIQQLAVTPLPHAYSSAWRHALTVGFITTMILGVGHRILPVFIRQPLASTRVMLASATLIIIGNAMRVTLELLTIGEWTWSYRLMGMSGVLELIALILFAVNLAATVRSRRRAYSGSAPIAPDTRVQEVVNIRPEVQWRLRELGVTMFDDAPFIAPSMTFGALALAWGMKPQELIDALNAPAEAANGAAAGNRAA